MIQIIVQAQKASCRKSSGERITTGMVGKKVSFDFSAEWDGLVKTAVFEGSGITKDVTLSGDTAVIPHECLTAPGGMLRVGVFGTDGTIQTPTVYTDIGQIEQGADPSGDTSADTTLPIWAQLQAMMGDLGNLTTTARDNLVAAINEAAKSGGTAADVRMQVAGGYIQYSSDGGKSWVNLIALSELIGAPGKTAYDYAVDAGYTGTESEFSARMAAEIPTVDGTLTQSGQAADAAVVGNRLSALSEEIVTTAESKVAEHNSGADTHSDIRVLIQGLTDRLNALADSDDTTLDQLSEVVAYIKSNRSLIEAITTSKVSVADIIDNLTTNVANKPLSAAQGVALKALIDAISVPDKLPNPNALTFTGAATGSYDGSEPVTVEIPSGGGSSGGSGKAKSQILIDQEITELTASLSVTLEHDFHNLTAIISCGSAGAALTAGSDGTAVASKIGFLIDTTSFGHNPRKVAYIDTSTATWQTRMMGAEWSDDLSVFKRGFAVEISTGKAQQYFFPFGGTTAMYGTVETVDNVPRTGRTANIVVNGAYLNVGTRVILWGEYYE